MKRSYFGTDGIRGEFGGPVINPEFTARLGAAVGRWLRAQAQVSAGAVLPLHAVSVRVPRSQRLRVIRRQRLA